MGKSFENRIQKDRRRIWELDFLRGLCVLLMIWDHFMYDSGYLFADAWLQSNNQALIGLTEFALSYFNGELRTIFHPVIFNIFFVICGISCSFSKNNLVRGIEALMLAFGITIVTSMLKVPITFGVLHMLGFAILIWWLIDTLCGHKRYITALFCLILGILFVCMDNILTACGGVNFNKDLFFLSELFGGSYGSADYFPIFPNAGVMLIGASVGAVLYRNKKSLLPCLDKYGWYKPISFWGRIALWVYVFHQLIVASILALVSYIILGDFIII